VLSRSDRILISSSSLVQSGSDRRESKKKKTTLARSWRPIVEIVCPWASFSALVHPSIAPGSRVGRLAFSLDRAGPSEHLTRPRVQHFFIAISDRANRKTNGLEGIAGIDRTLFLAPLTLGQRSSGVGRPSSRPSHTRSRRLARAWRRLVSSARLPLALLVGSPGCGDGLPSGAWASSKHNAGLLRFLFAEFNCCSF
jgi:hypothetical protein